MLKYSLMNKYMFAKYFSDKDRLIWFLKQLGIEVDDSISIVTEFEAQGDVEAKASRYDIRFVCNNFYGDLEGQNWKENEGYHKRREFHYLAQLHSLAYPTGALYDIKKKSFVIFINNFSLPGNERIIITRMQNDITKEVYDDLTIIDICLKNTNKCDNIELEELLNCFGQKQEHEYNSKHAREAMDLIKEWNEEDIAIFRAQCAQRQEMLMGSLKSMGRDEVVVGLIRNDVDDEIIIKSSGITKEELDRIKAEM